MRWDGIVVGCMVLVIIMTGVVVMGITQGFDARCERAGYEGAALERCVMRASGGGPIYEENAGYRP